MNFSLFKKAKEIQEVQQLPDVVVETTPQNNNTVSEEMLSYYMARCVEQENDLIAKSQQCQKLQQALDEKNMEFQLLKAELNAETKKRKNLERKVIKLSAVEKVWKETFNKLSLVIVPETETMTVIENEEPETIVEQDQEQVQEDDLSYEELIRDANYGNDFQEEYNV